MKVKEESEKVGLKFNIQKTKTMTSGPNSSVQFIRPVMSDSFWPHGLQQARPPCPSPTTRVCSNLMSTEWWCHPMISFSVSPSPSTFNFASIRVCSNESTLLIKWPKYWSFSFSISPSNEDPGLIFFRMDWLDLLAVQGTLKSLLHHHSSKTSILLCSTFFIVQLSHPQWLLEKPQPWLDRLLFAK